MRSAVLLLILLLQTGRGGTCPDCGDPTRPWLRGSIEKSCGTKEQLASLRKAHPERIILACACTHRCDPNDPQAGMTGDRAWDWRCEARCNPKGCQCPHPCHLDP